MGWRQPGVEASRMDDRRVRTTAGNIVAARSQAQGQGLAPDDPTQAQHKSQTRSLYYGRERLRRVMAGSEGSSMNTRLMRHLESREGCEGRCLRVQEQVECRVDGRRLPLHISRYHCCCCCMWSITPKALHARATVLVASQRHSSHGRSSGYTLLPTRSCLHEGVVRVNPAHRCLPPGEHLAAGTGHPTVKHTYTHSLLQPE